MQSSVDAPPPPAISINTGCFLLCGCVCVWKYRWIFALHPYKQLQVKSYMHGILHEGSSVTVEKLKSVHFYKTGGENQRKTQVLDTTGK